MLTFDEARRAALRANVPQPGDDTEIQWAADTDGFQTATSYIVQLNDRRFLQGDRAWMVLGGVAVVNKQTGRVTWDRLDLIQGDMRPISSTTDHP